MKSASGSGLASDLAHESNASWDEVDQGREGEVVEKETMSLEVSVRYRAWYAMSL